MKKVRGFEYISEIVEKLSQDAEDGVRVEEYFSLPQRSTKNSAGYDFFAPYDIEIPSNVCTDSYTKKRYQNPFCIKTGVKAYMQDDEVLEIYIRSSAPSKLGLVMANSVGIIDSDYYDNPENEGEIGFLVYNLTTLPIKISKGDKIGQGIFKKFLKADDDDVDAERTGGYGSTGK